jgi:hypothetical protein
MKTLMNQGTAVVIFNRSGEPRSVAFGLQGAAGDKIRDVWRHRDLGLFSGKFQALIPAHDVVFLTLKPD